MKVESTDSFHVYGIHVAASDGTDFAFFDSADWDLSFKFRGFRFV